MKIVVIGGTGLIGAKVVTELNGHGHEVVPASPRLGINAVTGEGLAAAVDGASVVVDVSNSPSFDYAMALEFFETSTRNLLAAERAAGVRHHVALSVVGTRELAESGERETTVAGYFSAKRAQEELITASPIPSTIVYATQFFEFINSIIESATDGTTVRVPPASFQPMAADDVAKAVARVAEGAPMGKVEIGGPELFPMDDLARRFLAASDDPREVLTDPGATYFGGTIGERTLVPGAGARLGGTRFDDWLSQAGAARNAAAARA